MWLYSELGLNKYLSKDLAYLSEAYAQMEDFWWKNYKAMETVKQIILAESPQFGEDRTYIYNPDSRLTSFLYPVHLSKITRKPTKGWANKDLLLELKHLGILVIDLFPYAFNGYDTVTTYPALKSKIILELAKRVHNFHIRPKLKNICDINSGDVRLCVRYDRVRRIAQNTFPPMLHQLSIPSSNFDSISKQGGMIDPEKLGHQYHTSQ